MIKEISENLAMRIQISTEGIKPFGESKFSGEILNSSLYKIYVVIHEGTIQYVGKTNQTIGDKFRENFRVYKSVSKGGDKPAGYSGYKWINKYIEKAEILDLVVVGLNTRENEFAEAIEAELTFLVRETTGLWPVCQNEIHFNNEYPDAKKCAINILVELYNKSLLK